MSIKISTGLRDHMLVTGSLKAALDGGIINIYSGVEPATADAALAGNTLLCQISNDATGAGLTISPTPASGIISKDPAQIWRGLIVASGLASFYRFQTLADDGSLSTANKRLQGKVGVVAADLVFSNVNFVAANYKAIDAYNLALPTL